MKVSFYGKIKEYTNNEGSYSPVSSVHSTLRDLLIELNEHYSESFTTFISSNETCLILVNGNGVKLTGGLDTPINQGDRIEILPFVEAG